MKLLFWETRKVCKNYVYLVFLVVILFVFFKNVYGVAENEIHFAEEKESVETGLKINRPVLLEPQPDYNSYGTKITENPRAIMTGAVDSLLSDYQKNLYATYPFGYYKAVKLSEKGQNDILSILSEITGLNEEQLDDIPDTYFPANNGTIFHLDGEEKSEDNQDEGPSIILNADEVTVDGTREKSEEGVSGKEEQIVESFIPQVTYERFCILMNKVCKIIGKCSEYEKNMLVFYFGLSDLNFDEAVQAYDVTIEQDKVTGGFARLFCDYMVIPLGLFPAFLISFLFLKDMKNEAKDVIYCKNVSTCKLVLSKYLATIIMTIVPIIILSIQPLLKLEKYAMENDLPSDALAYLKYIIWWLLPTVMLVVSFSMFLTVLTDTPIAILIQFLCWFISYGSTGLIGDISPFSLMIRHNSLEGYAIIENKIQQIWINRILLIVVSAVLVLAVIKLLDLKRMGKIEKRKKSKNRFNYIKRKFSFSN